MLRETSLKDDLGLHGSASHSIDFTADAPQRATLSASLNSASSQFHLAPGELLSPDPLPSPQQLSVSPNPYADFQHFDISADPFAGQIADNGKIIWSPEEAADNLNRYDVNYTFGNNGALDDGVLTYGFWQSQEEVTNSYYMEPMTDPETGEQFITDDAAWVASGYFAPFNAEQQAMAIENLGLWDDLINVRFEAADSAADADITFGFTVMSSAAGAHTYFPQEEAWNDYYGTTESGKISGDVWANWLYSGNYNPDINDFADTSAGNYAWFAITHELGHSLGLAHGGDYNASDDNDGDGQPDPITYEGDAYFYQDSQQYTIMSYFDGRVTVQAAVNWDTGYFVFAQTPAVHDILAVQNVYGADYTTRAGDTVYGFNSTADRAVFDFSQNTVPVLTIWDGGGNDTLDLSGFNADNVIDINEGAFSSAGNMISADAKAFYAGYFGIENDAEYAAFFAHNGLGPDGRPVDNIAIAYGAQIENAIGGSGNDLLVSNGLDNLLSGNGGSDTVSYDRATAAVTVDLSSHSATGGGGHDTLSSIENAIGSDFNDTLLGDAGQNILDGNAGNDVLNGGGGLDTASYLSATAGVRVDLGIAGAQNTLGAGSDTLISIENLTGSRFDDRLIGNNQANVMQGGDGIDVITLGGGNDTFVLELGTKASTKAGAISWDVITDFGAGDKIDVSHLGADLHFDGSSANKDLGDLTYKVYNSVNGAENALGIDIDGHDGAAGIRGPVTVVFANVDGGTPDIGLVLLNHNGVSAGDFLFA